MDDREFKFKIGDMVDIFQGWEKKLDSGIVVNRKVTCVTKGQGYHYRKEYWVSNLVADRSLIYLEEDLKHATPEDSQN